MLSGNSPKRLRLSPLPRRPRSCRVGMHILYGSSRRGSSLLSTRATQSRWSISECLCNNNLNNWKISFHSWFIRSVDQKTGRDFSFIWSYFTSYLMRDRDRPFFIRCHCELFSGGHCMREKHWLEFYNSIHSNSIRLMCCGWPDYGSYS